MKEAHSRKRNPARLLGLKKGELRPGYDADLILVDDRLNVRATWVGGELVKADPRFVQI